MVASCARHGESASVANKAPVGGWPSPQAESSSVNDQYVTRGAPPTEAAGSRDTSAQAQYDGLTGQEGDIPADVQDEVEFGRDKKEKKVKKGKKEHKEHKDKKEKKSKREANGTVAISSGDLGNLQHPECQGEWGQDALNEHSGDSYCSQTREQNVESWNVNPMCAPPGGADLPYPMSCSTAPMVDISCNPGYADKNGPSVDDWEPAAECWDSSMQSPDAWNQRSVGVSNTLDDSHHARNRTKGSYTSHVPSVAPLRLTGTGDVRPHAALHDGLKTHRDGVPGTFVGAAAGCPASSRVRNAVVDPVHQQCLGASQIPVTGSQLSASGVPAMSYSEVSSLQRRPHAQPGQCSSAPYVGQEKASDPIARRVAPPQAVQGLVDLGWVRQPVRSASGDINLDWVAAPPEPSVKASPALTSFSAAASNDEMCDDLMIRSPSPLQRTRSQRDDWWNRPTAASHLTLGPKSSRAPSGLSQTSAHLSAPSQTGVKLEHQRYQHLDQFGSHSALRGASVVPYDHTELLGAHSMPRFQSLTPLHLQQQCVPWLGPVGAPAVNAIKSEMDRLREELDSERALVVRNAAYINKLDLCCDELSQRLEESQQKLHVVREGQLVESRALRGELEAALAESAEEVTKTTHLQTRIQEEQIRHMMDTQTLERRLQQVEQQLRSGCTGGSGSFAPSPEPSPESQSRPLRGELREDVLGPESSGHLPAVCVDESAYSSKVMMGSGAIAPVYSQTTTHRFGSVQSVRALEGSTPVLAAALGSSSSSPKDTLSRREEGWSIEPKSFSAYEAAFRRADVRGEGYVEQFQVLEVLSGLALRPEQLALVWNLSDFDRDGRLSFNEFLCAMHLAHRHREGVAIPSTLPSELAALVAKVGPQSPFLDQTAVSSEHAIRSGRGPWSPDVEELEQYHNIFNFVDLDGCGYVDGDVGKELFERSQLDTADLLHIWRLCDADRDGRLSREEFTHAMAVLVRRRQGLELPSVLPTELQQATAHLNSSKCAANDFSSVD